MSTRLRISLVIAMMVNAVVFGIGAVAVLSIPSLNSDAAYWLPLVIVASFVASPFIAWTLAPMMRARWVRDQEQSRWTASAAAQRLHESRP